jgi:uncharacterized membrane protein
MGGRNRHRLGEFYGPAGPYRILAMHLRSPSVAAGVSSFLWAFAFGVCVWLFLLGIGSSRAMAVLLGLLTFCATFLYVRLSGRQGRLRKR